MPGMDGAALFRELRARRPALPIVLLSGVGNADLVEHLPDRSAASVLRKPYRAKELTDALDQLLNGLPG